MPLQTNFLLSAYGTQCCFKLRNMFYYMFQITLFAKFTYKHVVCRTCTLSSANITGFQRKLIHASKWLFSTVFYVILPQHSGFPYQEHVPYMTPFPFIRWQERADSNSICFSLFLGDLWRRDVPANRTTFCSIRVFYNYTTLLNPTFPHLVTRVSPTYHNSESNP